MKRFLALLLSVIMVLGMMPLTVFADEESCPHANMVYSDEFGAVAASCFEPGVRGYYYCEDCGRYFDEDKENEYWEPLPAAKIPATGHFFNTDTGECDECGLANPVYTKVTSLNDVNEEDLYIIVAEADGQYFVLGGLYDRYSDEQGNIWCPDGATNAIRVTANVDGSISLVNQEVLEDGSPSEFMLDVNPEQFGDMSWLGLTTVMLKLPNHCVYPFQTRYIYDNPDYDDTGYMGVSRYATEYGMWDSSEWIIDFYTTEVTEDTYRYEDEFGSKTHAQQVADGNIGNNIAEGDLLLYKASFYSVGGAMHTLRLREYNDQYYFICGEDWCLAGVGDQYYDENTNMWRQYTNDTQYAVSLYRYDVPASAHTCDFGDWVDAGDGRTHTRICKDSSCGKIESVSHAWNGGTETKAPTCTEEGVKTYVCGGCGAKKTEAIPAFNHDWSDWIYDSAESHVCHCENERCSAENYGAHEWGAWQSVDDNTHKATCPVCNGAKTDEHDFDDGEITKEPTEEEEGVLTYTCESCGYEKTESIDKETHVHNWLEWEDNENGGHSRCCNCGEKETEDHLFGDGRVVNAPSHLEEGLMVYTCSVCNANREQILAKTPDHTFTDGKCECGVEDPNYVPPHEHVFTDGKCECGAEDPNYVPPHEHKFGDWICEATVVGEHYRECECAERERGNCQWDEGKVSIEPGYDSYGERTFTCTLCGGTKKERIDMLLEVEEIVSPDNGDIKVSVPEGSSAVFEVGTTLEVEEANDRISENVKASIEVVVQNNKAEVLASYDISLLLDGARVQPGGAVEVTLPVPENAGEYDELQVVYIDDSGKATLCETHMNEDGTITFVTDHFSHYAIVGIPGSSSGVWIAITVISAVLIAGAVVAVFLIKKKNGDA